MMAGVAGAMQQSNDELLVLSASALSEAHQYALVFSLEPSSKLIHSC